MEQQQLGQKLSSVLERVRLAEEKYQRISYGCSLLAVSKTKPAENIRSAFALGQRAFGENYLSEALEKIEQLGDLPIEWHFIGPIQSNKTRAIAAAFQWVHGVDRLKIARRLSEQRPDDMEALQICVQVNISEEASKSGAAPGEVRDLVEAISELPRLNLRGLMAIPAPSQDFEAQRKPFQRLAQLLETCQAICPEMDTLSMGMSADLEAAVAEGSTMVRIGTDIFGPRDG